MGRWLPWIGTGLLCLAVGCSESKNATTTDLAGCVACGSGDLGGDGGSPGNDDGGASDMAKDQVPVTPGGPALLFSDLVNGTRTGNSDTSLGQTSNADGAIVTVWGKNLGPSQGTSMITVGGVAARVYSWGPASKPVDLHTRMGLEMIELQVPAAAPLGDAPIQVTVGGIPSNTLPFTTRAQGKIYFVGPGPGGKDTNAGSFAAPWLTWDHAKSALAPGDVVYFLDGFVDGSLDYGTHACMSLAPSGGTTALPYAIVAYPGATATVDPSSCDGQGISGYSFSANAFIPNWVIAKFRLTAAATADNALFLYAGYRAIANYISLPKNSAGCQVGAIQCGGSVDCGNDVVILGNELTAMSHDTLSTVSKLCHTIYISGSRFAAGTESRREIGWNYIHDNLNDRGINVYNEGGSHADITDHVIHDNWIENQRGVGILVGQFVTGANAVYNNVLIETGLGPDWQDGQGGHAAMQLTAGGDSLAATLRVYNNLIYRGGFDGAITGNGLVLYDPAAEVSFVFRDNIVVAPAVSMPYFIPANASGTTGAGSATSNCPDNAFKGTGQICAPASGAWDNLFLGAGGAPSWDTAAKNSDPLFVGASSGDYHLQPASPAKGGEAANPFALALDFDGVPRKSAGPISIGPYE